VKRSLGLIGLLAYSILIMGNARAELPLFVENLTIKTIETWPNSTNPESGYTVVLNSSMIGTGCSNSDRFSVEAGDFQDDSLSVLLAAMISGKNIHVRVSKCTDRPVVDRVGINN